MVLYTLGYIIVKALFALGLYELISEFTNDPSLTFELSELLATAIILAVIVWVILKKRIFHKQHVVYDYSRVKLIFILITMMIGLRLVEDPFFHYKNILFNEPLLNLDNIEPFTMTVAKLVSLLHIMVFAPVVEELFFRKLIFKKLSENYSKPILPLFVSSALFALSHFSLVNTIPTFMFGVISAFIYYRTNSIFNSILAHIFSNLIWSALTIGLNYQYWEIQHHLNFNSLYWLIVIFGIILIISSCKYLNNITSSN